MTLIIEPLRAGGRGLEATYEVIDAYAPDVRPFMEAVSAAIPLMNFTRWRQGHNLHIFETKDGRRFDLVLLKANNEYVGLRFRYHRSRSDKVVLMDCMNRGRITQMIVLMQAVANAIDPDYSAGMGIDD
jgi:hypothetical protein